MTQLEAELLKIIRGQLVTGEARLSDHAQTAFRWLMATLFAANGGAILAVPGLGGSSDQPANLIALGCFATGLALSIVMGALSIVWSFLAGLRMDKVRWSIDQSLLTGAIDQQALDKFVAQVNFTWKTWIPSYVGGASFVCLIGGMLAVACRL